MKKIPFKPVNSVTTPCTAKHSRKGSNEKSDKKKKKFNFGDMKKKYSSHTHNINQINKNNYYSNYHSNPKPTACTSLNTKLKQSQSTSLSKIKKIIIPTTNDLRGLLTKYSILSHLTSHLSTKQKNQQISISKPTSKNSKKKGTNSSQLSKSYIKNEMNNSKVMSSSHQTTLIHHHRHNKTKITRQNIKPIFPVTLPTYKKKCINDDPILGVAKTTTNMLCQRINGKIKNKSTNSTNANLVRMHNIDFIYTKFPYYSSKTSSNTNTNIKKESKTFKKDKESSAVTRNLSSNTSNKKGKKSINKRLNDNKIIPTNTNDSNCSNQSLSTSRESNYYKNESKKLSDYIKSYKNDYPKTTIQFYRIGRRVGHGAFGKVNIGLHILSGHIVAIKSFNKAKNIFSKSKINYEAKLMKKLRGHKNIVKIFEEVETDKHICIIMENVPGGNLLSLISKRTKLTEETTKYIFRQIIEGLRYIHSQGIAHRDIKPDNILIDLNNVIKICDFGVGKEIKHGQLIRDTCGTPAFVAPEILSDTPYDPFQADIWSSGVVLYSMLSGLFPFRGNNDYELHKSILSGKYLKIKDISKECSDLLSKMLDTNPDSRITIDQIMMHEWFVGGTNNDLEYYNLFTNAEKIIYSKLSIDYRYAKKEDIIEYFTYKNIDSDLENENQNAKTKSFLATPFNTHFRIGNDDDDELFFQELKIEDEIMKFTPRVIELNREYERDNNEETDQSKIRDDKKKGRRLMISLNNSLNNEKGSGAKEGEEEIGSNQNQNIKITSELNIDNSGSKDNLNLKMIKNNKDTFSTNSNTFFIDDNAIRFVEDFGYKREYIIKSLENNEMNHATATYYLKLSLQNE